MFRNAERSERRSHAERWNYERTAQDTLLVRALGLVYYWQKLLGEGKHRSLKDIAAAEGTDLGQASRIVRLTRLAPEIVEACLASLENRLTIESLNQQGMPVDWALRHNQWLPWS